MFTRVLLGNLEVTRIAFPKDSRFAGQDLDILARKHLFAVGEDYKHGTGHGVGSFLCVHEGPQGLSRGYKLQYEIGQCISNEPGFYKEGEFGVRIEDIIMCVKHPKYENFLTFYNMVLIPYCRKLIDESLLTRADKEYLNEYNKLCLEKVGPFLKDNEKATAYLQREC